MQNSSTKVNDHTDPRTSSIVAKALLRKRKRILRGIRSSVMQHNQEMRRTAFHKLRQVAKIISDKKLSCVVARAEKLVLDHVAKDPQAIVDMALKLLKNVAEHADVELTVHPKSGSAISASLGTITQTLSFPRKIMVVEDPSMSPASILVKANSSIIDAHIKTQTNRALEILATRIETSNGTTY